MKVAITCKVLQKYRVPVFEKLSVDNDIVVFYGCDFKGTKVVSAQGGFNFRSKKLFSFPISFKNSRGNMTLPFSPSLLYELVKFKPDVVLCEGASNFLNNIIVYVYCKLFKKSMVQWGLGEIRGRKKGGVRKFLDPLIVPIERRANSVVVYSSVGAKYYEKVGVPKDKIFVAVNVVDTEKRALEIQAFNDTRETSNNIQSTIFKVLFIGALEENKNIDMLFYSFKHFHDEFSDSELHIVGDGAYRGDLVNLARKLRIEDSIIFHGRISGALVDTVFDMDVFVMPGLGGLAVSDALSHGIPVICGIGDGCEVDLINETNGIRDDLLDEKKLLHYLIQLKKTPEVLTEMKVNAKNTILRYNISNYVNQINCALEYATRNNNDL